MTRIVSARRIHIHTDCDFFAGCENMVGILADSEEINQAYDVSLSYRLTESYENGFRKRVKKSTKIFPIKLSVPSISIQSSSGYFPKIIRYRRFFVFALNYSFSIIQNFYVLYRLFKKIRPEILHVNNGGYPGSLSCRVAVLAARLSGCRKVIFFVNNMAIDYGSIYRKMDWLLDFLVVREVKLFLTGSSEANQQLARVLNIPESRRMTIPNAIEIREIQESRHQSRKRLGISSEDTIVFGMVGVMLPRKGHQVLIDALNFIRVNGLLIGANFKVFIEGEFKDFRELESQTRELCLNEMVKFGGPEERIFEFLNAIDFLIYPSVVDEDFPNVISEALSMGVPVLASRVAGANEQIEHSVNGFLFERGNFEDLAAQIIRIVQNPGLAKGFSNAAILKYRLNYTPEVVINKYLNLYRELAGENEDQ